VQAVSMRLCFVSTARGKRALQPTRRNVMMRAAGELRRPFLTPLEVPSAAVSGADAASVDVCMRPSQHHRWPTLDSLGVSGDSWGARLPSPHHRSRCWPAPGRPGRSTSNLPDDFGRHGGNNDGITLAQGLVVLGCSATGAPRSPATSSTVISKPESKIPSPSWCTHPA